MSYTTATAINCIYASIAALAITIAYLLYLLVKIRISKVKLLDMFRVMPGVLRESTVEDRKSFSIELNGVDIEISHDDVRKWKWGPSGFRTGARRGFKSAVDAVEDVTAYYEAAFPNRPLPFPEHDPLDYLNEVIGTCVKCGMKIYGGEAHSAGYGGTRCPNHPLIRDEDGKEIG